MTACKTALCRCAVGNVGLKVGIEKVESHRPITQPRVERYSRIFSAEIRHTNAAWRLNSGKVIGLFTNGHTDTNTRHNSFR